MNDQDKTKEQLVAELEELRQRVAALEGIECERQRTEEELAKNRAVLRATIDSLPFNFFAIGLDGRYMLQNAESKAQNRADAIGRLPEEVCPNKEDLAIWLDNNRRAFAGEKVEGEVSLMLTGEKRFYYNIIAPIRDGKALHGILGVNIDITERKRAEEALRQARDELEQRVAERTAELRAANEELARDITARKQAEKALERERRTLKHMLRASDHERRLIAYDIHDGLAQELAAAIMQFQIYEHQKDARPQDALKTFNTGMAMLQQSHAETRRLITGVRPPILDESGVVAAIAHLIYDPAFDEGPKIEFRNRVAFQRLAPILENVIYRIVQEGLTNARNHSQSKKILVSLLQRDDRLRIEIRDWGVGFDPQTVKEHHFGVEGIRERARLLGGKCSIKSQPGEGTTISVELPAVERELESA
jgi:PAS domain S-box-containing protein